MSYILYTLEFLSHGGVETVPGYIHLYHMLIVPIGLRCPGWSTFVSDRAPLHGPIHSALCRGSRLELGHLHSLVRSPGHFRQDVHQRGPRRERWCYPNEECRLG